MDYSSGSVARSREDSYTVPPEIANAIRFIDGISNPFAPEVSAANKETLRNENNKTKPEKKHRKNKVDTERFDNGLFTREVAIRLYNITYDTVQHRSSGGVIEFQEGGYQPKFIRHFEKMNGIPANKPCLNIGHNDGDDVETILDLQMMTTIAAGLCQGYLSYPAWLYSAFANLVTRSDIPDVISISYGWAIEQQCQIAKCNQSENQKYVYSVDTEFVKLGLMGKTLVSASGDAGAPSRSNEGCQTFANNVRMFAEYPGASPYVLSVGGTILGKSDQHFSPQTPICKEYACANGTVQHSINYNNAQWTTSSGFNVYSNRSNEAQWQDQFVNEYMESGVYLPEYPEIWNSYGRAYPDVSAIGNSCATWGAMGPSVVPVGGTSCSAPSVGAMIVLLNDRFNKTLGFINPLLYQSFNNGTFDSVRSTNTSCTEVECCDHDFGFGVNLKNETRWNAVSGLGSINFGRLEEYIQSLFNF